MNERTKKFFTATAVLFLIFLLFTLAVKVIDVKAIGPQGSEVGFAAVNSLFFKGEVKNGWYKLTELLGYLAILVAAGFAALGGLQLVKRRSLAKVDTEIIILAVFYILTMCFYVLFEKLIVNYRPVIIDLEEGLEASYPSSHTVLTVCIMGSSVFMIRKYLAGTALELPLKGACAVIALLTIIGRLVSGVHWFTDIIGGILLSAALVMLFYSACELLCGSEKGAGYRPAHLK